MIVLTSTQKLQLVVSAGTVDVDVDFNDRTATAYGPSDSQQTAGTAATNDICSAPAASTSREINNLFVNYKTTGGTLTLQKFNSSGSVTTILWKGVLLVGENVVYTHGGGLIVLDANGNRKEVTGSLFSSLTVTGLLDISATGAGQIKFPATQNPSSDANTLDDYEEGTWTPSITFGGGSTGLTYTTQSGTYTKIGREVGVVMRLTINDNGSSTGSMEIAGLPFTIATLNNTLSSFINGYSGISVGWSIIGISATTTMRPFFGGGAGSVTQFTDTQAINGADMTASGLYFV